MANSNKSDREAKARVARMKANQELAGNQVSRRKRDNLIAAAASVAALALAATLALTIFAPHKDTPAADGATPAPSASATAAPTETNSPGVPNADTAKGKTFTGTLTINGKPLGVSLDGTAAPRQPPCSSPWPTPTSLQARPATA